MHRAVKKYVLGPSFYVMLIIKRYINFLPSVTVDFLWHNGFRCWKWLLSRALEGQQKFTHTYPLPIPDINESCRFHKRRGMFLLAECCITEVCSTEFNSYTKTLASLVLFSTPCLQLIHPSRQWNNRTASLKSSVWNGLRYLALNVSTHIG